ncbi:MAG TPA: type IV toxin-antitoxin system AbiEi family antitoxin [bacterium]|jgi:hypothetical protein|nr:type IV toxin-antitoxin system AbiEi family antitoxin [bacterium]HNT66903.1 type IV toxin-antitoxin system AbiEi family antitoxin [bacterium]HOX86746.1 type IV toxin-antitoxin system AbiEi family antitoxin [bacterium]HPG46065.1 type IV toxin-antitoxin system AbiEi family antitoxin [bacterium]HPM98308.1 type IV toxin-antitoxin system AbiEi family antitoxin [bacterium]
MKAIEQDQLFQELLRKNLLAIPFLTSVDIQLAGQDHRAAGDYWVTLGVSGKNIHLIVEVLGNGEPRYIRQSISKMHEWLKRMDHAYGLIVAPALFDKSAALCREAGISYLDFSGNCWLSFQNIYIERQGNSELRPEKKLLKSLYYPKAERILRVLLATPGRSWKTEALAREAGVSIGMVFKVKQHLLKLEWARDGRDGIQLFAWRDLLEDWKRNYTYQKSQVDQFYSLDSRIENGLATVCSSRNLRYAMALFSGVARVAPYTRIKQLFAYVEKDVALIGTELDLKPVDSGSNVTLLTPYDQGVFYGVQQVDGIMIASPVQLYLDLNSYHGRGEEAAQFLFDKILEPLWSAN